MVTPGRNAVDEKKRLEKIAALLVFWLAVVSCKMPDILGGVGRAIEGVFRSIGGLFGM